MELMEFEERRGGKDLKHWIRYNRKFGHMHLINPHHRRSYRAVYDLDIKAAILVIVALIIWLIYKAVIKLLGCKFKSKYDREQLT